MKLPNAIKAVVPESKIKNYLLSETHDKGKDKAVFFTSFGFVLEGWEVLAQALLQHAANYEVTKMVESEYGMRYVIEGRLQTPDGRNPDIRSVWFIDMDDIIP
ncbi:MAG: hypothetical protein K8I82_03620, partial [Anaerolineae bacterium]|nr:hypothetical protein [Anaerolineae bacterium]